MKRVKFNQEKNRKLKKERGISLDDVAKIIEKNGFVGIVEHPNKKKYPKQRMFLVKVENYIFIIPFVEDKQKIFLKTLYPSRKYTKKYIKS